MEKEERKQRREICVILREDAELQLAKSAEQIKARLEYGERWVPGRA